MSTKREQMTDDELEDRLRRSLMGALAALEELQKRRQDRDSKIDEDSAHPE